MPTTSTAALLEAWERGRDASPGERGLIFLGVARPEAPAPVLSKWPVGKRDAALLALSERLFGSQLAAQANCPRCAALLEMEVDVARLGATAPHEIVDAFVCELAGYRVTYRLPSAGDLAALGRTARVEGDPQPSRWLLQRCIVQIDTDHAAEEQNAPRLANEPELGAQAAVSSVEVPASRPIEIPAAVLAALESEIADKVTAADPLAEIALEMECPVCAASWSAPFDIVRFLWDEVHAWAWHVLEEVHVLASSYGWRESDILALSPQRRQHYRDLIGL